MNLRQGQQSVTDYSIDFRNRVSLSGWNPAVQIDAFRHGLSDYMKDKWVMHKVPSSLDDIINMAAALTFVCRIGIESDTRGKAIICHWVQATENTPAHPNLQTCHNQIHAAGLHLPYPYRVGR